MENSIERKIELKAPVSKVWKALVDSKSFGTWFKASFPDPFVAGKTVVAKNLTKGYEFEMKFYVKAIKPETYFAYA